MKNYTVGELLAAPITAGLRLDGYAAHWAHTVRDNGVVALTPPTFLTPRQLGCTEHPTTGELLNTSRLRAWSRSNLPPDSVLDRIRSEDFIRDGASVHQEKPQGICAASDTLKSYWDWESGESLVLQFVCSATSGECWLYAVPINGGKRWSLDQPFLFDVRPIDSHRNERKRIERAQMPVQEPPDEIVVTPRSPLYIPDMTPGRNCGQMAIRHVLGAFGVVDPVFEDRNPFRELTIGGPWGYLNYATGKLFLPGSLPTVLARYGIKAKTHFCLRQDFERTLERAIREGHMVIILAYAQRRLHGQHYQVVSGFERYRSKLHWYVTDGQFAGGEYQLARGNVLLSTADFLRSFPRYVLWRWAPGVFITVIESI